MLYGTRKQLNNTLKRAFGDTEKFALLVWTRETVMAQTEDMTEEEADRILALIGRAGAGDHTEQGISYLTVQEMLAGLRAEPKKIAVSADLLAQVAGVAERALMAEESAAFDAGRSVPEAVSMNVSALRVQRHLMDGSELHE